MMWIVYDINTLKVYQKCYTKKTAKEWIWVHGYHLRNKEVSLQKVDLEEFSKWHMWEILKCTGNG